MTANVYFRIDFVIVRCFSRPPNDVFRTRLYHFVNDLIEKGQTSNAKQQKALRNQFSFPTGTHFHYSEIGQTDISHGVYQNVRRLHIAVYYSVVGTM